MLRRFFLELMVLIILLFACIIYGAITVRDNQTAAASGALQVAVPAVAASQQPAVQVPKRLQTAAAPPAASGLSNHVSRLFLGVVSTGAGAVNGILQMLLH
ncbi:MAG: hypothetical protein ABF868_01705 [Sporolactobacillus sp.]